MFTKPPLSDRLIQGNFRTRRTTMRKFTSMLIVTMVAMIALVACSSDKGESGSTQEQLMINHLTKELGKEF